MAEKRIVGRNPEHPLKSVVKFGMNLHRPDPQLEARRLAVHRPLLLSLSVAAEQLRTDQMNLIIKLALRNCAMANSALRIQIICDSGHPGDWLTELRITLCPLTSGLRLCDIPHIT